MLSCLILCMLGFVSSCLGVLSHGEAERPPGFKVVPHLALQAQPGLGESPSYQPKQPPILPYYPYYAPYLLPPPIPYLGPIVNVSDAKNMLRPQLEQAASLPESNFKKVSKKHPKKEKKIDKILRGLHSNMVEPEVNPIWEAYKKPDHQDKFNSSNGSSDEGNHEKSHQNRQSSEEDDHDKSNSSSGSSEEDSSSSGGSDEEREQHSRAILGTGPQHFGMSSAPLRERNGSGESDDLSSEEDSETDENDNDDITESSETRKGLRIDEGGEIISGPSRERTSEEDDSKSKNPRRQSGKNKNLPALSEEASKSREVNSSKHLNAVKDRDEKNRSKDKSGSNEDTNTIRNAVKIFPPQQNTSNLNKTNPLEKHAHITPTTDNFTFPLELYAKKFKPSTVKLPTLLMWLIDQTKKSVIGRVVLLAWPSIYEGITTLGEHLINSSLIAWDRLTTELAVPGNEETRIIAILRNILFDKI